MAAGVYNRGKASLANGGVDWDTTDIRGLLVTSSYTFDNAHNTLSEVTTNEVTGGTYVRKATTRTVVENDTSDRAELTVANIVWTALTCTGTPAALILTKYVDGTGTDIVFSYHDFTPTAANGGDYTVAFTSTNAILLT